MYGFTQDIAMIKVDKSKIDKNNFHRNVIDLGTEINSSDFTSQMNDEHQCFQSQKVYLSS